MKPVARPLRHDDHGLLLGQLALVLAPQARTLPVAVSLLLVLLLGWRWLLWRRRAPLPSRWMLGITAVMVLLVASALVWQDGGGMGRELAVALLGAFVILKLLECRALSDATLVTQLSFYLLLTLYLSDQPFWLALYSLAIGAWVLRNWLLLHHPEARSRLAIWPLLGRMALLGLPWALALFVLFPRLEHPLWQLPQSAPRGTTGISDTMRPSSVGQLIRSPEIALRAEVAGPALPAAALYWRALVLWEYDGTTWHPSRQRRQQLAPAPAAGNTNGIDISITLEPSQQRWLFALDRGQALSAGVDGAATPDGEFMVRRPVDQRIRYRTHSTLSPAPEALTAATRRLALSLPDGNPRARALAAQWADRHADPVARVQAALRLFAAAPFAYTLSPPPLGSDQVDSFVFDTRRGFCEHYASSFVFLMRAAGVPARVVTGYQGGEYNPIGNHYVVRQSDAHAWAEVWLDGRGWVRVDPTSAVAPGRIEQGLDAVVGSEAADWRPSQQPAWLKDLRWAYEGVVYTWQRWVLQYDHAQQQRLLLALGAGVGAGQLLAGVLGALCLLALVPLWRRRGPADPVDAAYARFCALLARHGCERAQAEGPQDFAARASARLPRAADAIAAVSAAYVGLRYGNLQAAGHAQALAAMRAGIRQIAAALRH
ncbi:Transglutaminase-like enzyme, putative cysteine protease [Cupriavidus necator]|uniref:transglutaminase TgpA family protein n=1 Tax=Cupriavidus necator TaxID=106590 RepID=UPI003F74060C